MTPGHEPMTPEALAAELSATTASEVGPTLACTARRAYHVALYGPPEYPGDGIGEPSKREVDAWAAAISVATRVLNADRDRLTAELATSRERSAENRRAHANALDERDQAREQLDEIRAMVRATPAHFSAEQMAIVLRAIGEAAGLEPS